MITSAAPGARPGREALQLADQETADDRAPKAAEPADHDDDERGHEKVEAGAGIDAVDRADAAAPTSPAIAAPRAKMSVEA